VNLDDFSAKKQNENPMTHQLMDEFSSYFCQESCEEKQNKEAVLPIHSFSLGDATQFPARQKECS
jgi:hypothetical protein